MPVDLRIYTKSGAVDKFPYLSPGEAKAINEYPNGRKESLIIECHPLDLGANLYITDLDTEHGDDIPPHLLKAYRRIGRLCVIRHDLEARLMYIPPGQQHEFTIVNQQKKPDTVSIRHIGMFADRRALMANNEHKRHAYPAVKDWKYLRGKNGR